MRPPSETRPGLYLVTPYCAAGSLQAHLLGGGSGLKSFEDRIKVARGLAAGLAHLHAKRIFHRDVKPDNVLLTAAFEPRLADFGVSKDVAMGGFAEKATSYATVHQVGTAGYAAPEVQFGKYGPKTDTYAAGVVLLQLVTGKPAVMVDASDSVPRPLRAHLLAQPGVPSGLSDSPSVPAEWAAFAAGQADPRCAWPPAAASGLMLLGLRCTEELPRARPFADEMALIIGDLVKPDGGESAFGFRPDLLVSEAALTCTICEEARRDCLLLPCNHAVGCGPCTAKLDTCPLCRAPKESVLPLDGPVFQTWQGPVGGGRGWTPLLEGEMAEMQALLTEKRRKAADEARLQAEAAEKKRREEEEEARKRTVRNERLDAELPAVPAWWAEQHEAAAVRADPPSGWVFVPEKFDVTVAPGEDIQAAVDACPPGGSVLLQPGTHAGPLALKADKEVHVFGRGRALLQSAAFGVIASEAARSTLDGLIVRCESKSKGRGEREGGITVKGGRLRIQACDVTSASIPCISIGGGDPTVASCRCSGRGRAPPERNRHKALLQGSTRS